MPDPKPPRARWTPEEVVKLRDMAAGGSWVHHIAKSLGRTSEQVVSKASREGVLLNWSKPQAAGSSQYVYELASAPPRQTTVWAKGQAEAEKLTRERLRKRFSAAGETLPADAPLRLQSITTRGTEV